MAALGARLESVLELLAQLITIIKPPANSLLPVLRVAGQALTLQKHELLQLKATGTCTLSPWWPLCLNSLALCCKSSFQHQTPVPACAWWSIPDQQAAVPTMLGCLIEMMRTCYAGLLVAAFEQFPSLRFQLMDELLSSLLPNLPTEGHARIPVDGQNSIRTITSLVLQMLQASCSAR